MKCFSTIIKCFAGKRKSKRQEKIIKKPTPITLADLLKAEDELTQRLTILEEPEMANNVVSPEIKATANVTPQHWQPNSGLVMNNDVSGVNLEEAVPCVALSKNDSYVMPDAAGKVSLFNMMTFKLCVWSIETREKKKCIAIQMPVGRAPNGNTKVQFHSEKLRLLICHESQLAIYDASKMERIRQVMRTFMPPPPASTYLAFHPQDNHIIAISMEDSTIHIYNVRVDEEAERNENGKAARSKWRNYDFNEYFWSPACFKLGWPMKKDSAFVLKPSKKGKRTGKTCFVEEMEIELEATKLELATLKKGGSRDDNESRSEENVVQSREVVESLKSELQLARDQLAQALDGEKNAKMNIRSLQDELALVKNELKQANSAQETSKTAMDELALALKEVATESNQVKEKLQGTLLELENVKKDSEQLKDVVRSTDERYKKLLAEAKKETELYKNTADRLRLEAQESLLAWNGKELGFVKCIKSSEDEKVVVEHEKAKLLSSASIERKVENKETNVNLKPSSSYDEHNKEDEDASNLIAGSKSCSSFENDKVSDQSSTSISQITYGDLEQADSTCSSSAWSRIATDSIPSYTASKGPYNWELEYIKCIVDNADLMLEEFALGQVHRVMDPDLFDHLENCIAESNNNLEEEQFRVARRALFDCVEECLQSRCKRNFCGSSKAWSKSMIVFRKSDHLAEDLYREIVSLANMVDVTIKELDDMDGTIRDEKWVREVVDKDVKGDGRWVEFEAETLEEGIEIEIENEILTMLVDELLDDICCC